MRCGIGDTERQRISREAGIDGQHVKQAIRRQQPREGGPTPRRRRAAG